jgi:hypothetical protein
LSSRLDETAAIPVIQENGVFAVSPVQDVFLFSPGRNLALSLAVMASD